MCCRLEIRCWWRKLLLLTLMVVLWGLRFLRDGYVGDAVGWLWFGGLVLRWAWMNGYLLDYVLCADLDVVDQYVCKVDGGGEVARGARLPVNEE